MEFNEDRTAEWVRKIEEVAMKLDPGCEIDVDIITALHTETYRPVSRRLRIEIDFTCFDK